MVLGFIIFGWPMRTKEYGPAYPTICPHCSNEAFYHLVKTRRWLSLFFIPIFPLWFSHKYIACEVCSQFVELEERDEWRAAKNAVSITSEYAAGELTESEYLDEIRSEDADPGLFIWENGSELPVESVTS